MKYKEIVFDFDGTIVDTVSALISFVREGNVDLKLPEVNDENIQMIRGMSPEEIMKELGLKKYQLVRYVGKFVRYARKNPEIYNVIEGMPGVINRLSEQYTLGVLSSNKKDVIETVLKMNGIDKFEYFVTGAALWGKEKKLKKLLKDRSLENSDILYIGDEVKDVEGAQKAEVDILSVSWGYNTYEILNGLNNGMVVKTPDEIVERLTE